MKERPIIFGAESVQAILNNRKTQTRRVVQFKEWPDVPVFRMTEHKSPYTDSPANEQFWTADHQGPREFYAENDLRCPYGLSGDRLWVRETFCIDDRKGTHYRATPEPGPAFLTAEWDSPIHMPRKLSRITLEIMKVRVERLWAISDPDVRAEGVFVLHGSVSSYYDHFTILWNSINAKRGYPWESNPWVWVVEFKRIEARTA